MAELKDIQNTELEMLTYFDQICTENGLHYVMLYGTLLGAVRHQGFIPWDDDVDVYMSVNDFKKFRKVFKSEEYFLQSPETDPESLYVMYKLRKNGTYMQEPGLENVKMHQGIWMDIFVYTDAGKSKLAQKCQLALLRVLQTYRCRYLNARQDPPRKLYVLLSKLPQGLALKLDHLISGLIQLLGSKKSDMYFFLDVETKYFFKKSLIDTRQKYKFEDKEFWGVKDYNSYLTDIYGSDYMTPKRWSHLSDYSDVIA